MQFVFETITNIKEKEETVFILNFVKKYNIIVSIQEYYRFYYSTKLQIIT